MGERRNNTGSDTIEHLLVDFILPEISVSDSKLQKRLEKIRKWYQNPETSLMIQNNPDIRTQHTQFLSAFDTLTQNPEDPQNIKNASQASQDLLYEIELAEPSMKTAESQDKDLSATPEEIRQYQEIFRVLEASNWTSVDRNELQISELARQLGKYLVVAEIPNPLAGKKISKKDLLGGASKLPIESDELIPQAATLYFLSTASTLKSLPTEIPGAETATLRAYINRNYIAQKSDGRTIFGRKAIPLQQSREKTEKHWEINTSIDSLDADLAAFHENGWFTLEQKVIDDWKSGKNIDLKMDFSTISIAAVEKSPGNFEYFAHLDAQTPAPIPEGVSQKTQENGQYYFIVTPIANIDPQSRQEASYRKPYKAKIDTEKNISFESLDQKTSDLCLAAFQNGWKILDSSLYTQWTNRKTEILNHDYISLLEVHIPGKTEPLVFCKPSNYILQTPEAEILQKLQEFPHEIKYLVRCSKIEANNSVKHRLKEGKARKDGLLELPDGTKTENIENQFYNQGFFSIDPQTFVNWKEQKQIPGSVITALKLEPEKIANLVVTEVVDKTSGVVQYFCCFNFDPLVDIKHFLPEETSTTVASYATHLDTNTNMIQMEVFGEEIKIEKEKTETKAQQEEGRKRVEARDKKDAFERKATQILLKNEQIHKLCIRLRELRGIETNPEDIQNNLDFIFSILGGKTEGQALATNDTEAIDPDTARLVVELLGIRLQAMTEDELSHFENLVAQTLNSIQALVEQEEVEQIKKTQNQQIVNLPNKKPSFWKKPWAYVAASALAGFVWVAGKFLPEGTLENNKNTPEASQQLPPEIIKVTMSADAKLPAPEQKLAVLEDAASKVPNLPVSSTEVQNTKTKDLPNTNSSEEKRKTKEIESKKQSLVIQEGDRTIPLVTDSILAKEKGLKRIDVQRSVAIFALKDAAHRIIHPNDILEFDYSLSPDGKINIKYIKHIEAKDTTPKSGKDLSTSTEKITKTKAEIVQKEKLVPSEQKATVLYMNSKGEYGKYTMTTEGAAPGSVILEGFSNGKKLVFAVKKETLEKRAEVLDLDTDYGSFGVKKIDDRTDKIQFIESGKGIQDMLLDYFMKHKGLNRPAALLEKSKVLAKTKKLPDFVEIGDWILLTLNIEKDEKGKDQYTLTKIFKKHPNITELPKK